MSDRTRIFLSCVSPEFENPGGKFEGLRTRLAQALRRADCEVLVQEDFPQTRDDIVLKTAKDIGSCAIVIHLVGALPGSVANAKARAEYLAAEPNLLPAHPDLRAALGECADVTYTQWEAFQALHHDKLLLVYATAAGDAAQAAHLGRLRLGRRFATVVADEADLFAKLLGDLRHADARRLLGDARALAPAFEAATAQRIARPRFLHHTAEFFLGREPELQLLDHAWANGTHVLSVIAWGGVGKTALLSEWIQTRFMARNWKDVRGNPSPAAYFDWSFYDQGTKPSSDESAVRTGSVGDFFEQALGHFGDPDVRRPGKGARLAEYVREQRTLFVLDGLEPLQQPLGSPTAGRLLDPDLRDFVWMLAQQNPGLLVLTSRQVLTDLDGLNVPVADKHDLDDLPKAVAVRLLRKLQIAGSDEQLGEASDKLGCHALSLTLLGRFLFDAHGGDVRRIDRVRDLQRADKLTRAERHRTAWKVLEAYEDWLKGGTDPGALTVLRLTGLFDRTANAGCLGALRAEPVILGLTDALVKMEDDEWKILLKRLERAHLLKLREEQDGRQGLDAHPLIREYFAKQLREKQPEAFRAAHSRLFDHLCTTTPHRPDTLDGLQPLYQAVMHGCLAGRHPEACDTVFYDRILRGGGGDGYYSERKLGAIGPNLAVTAAFFDEPWTHLAPTLAEADQAWVLGMSAYGLRSLGRLTEALQPMQSAEAMLLQQEAWKGAATTAGNLSELYLAIGQVTKAVDHGQVGIELADRSGDTFEPISNRVKAADALHQAGSRVKAGSLFADAEILQKAQKPGADLLYSQGGFFYCDWLLAPTEQAAWRSALGSQLTSAERTDHATMCETVKHRADSSLSWARAAGSRLNIAMDYLSLARVGIFKAMITNPVPQSALAVPNVVDSVNNFRAAGFIDDLPRGLLTAALYHFVRGEHDTARAYLDECQQIAERGPMPLFIADVHLHRARMFRDRAELAKAAKLIHDLGYGRRYDELADAEAALGAAAT
ncbi:MAG TPA: hypothetical protein VD866_31970 [Urbifossiella sp.]|nr:hypothetical protein [Urbifossiella sp.]